MYEVVKPIIMIRELSSSDVIYETTINSDFSYIRKKLSDGSYLEGILDSSETEAIKKKIDELNRIESIMDEALL